MPHHTLARGMLESMPAGHDDCWSFNPIPEGWTCVIRSRKESLWSEAFVRGGRGRVHEWFALISVVVVVALLGRWLRGWRISRGPMWDLLSAIVMGAVIMLAGFAAAMPVRRRIEVSGSVVRYRTGRWGLRRTRTMGLSAVRSLAIRIAAAPFVGEDRDANVGFTELDRVRLELHAEGAALGLLETDRATARRLAGAMVARWPRSLRVEEEQPSS